MNRFFDEFRKKLDDDFRHEARPVNSFFEEIRWRLDDDFCNHADVEGILSEYNLHKLKEINPPEVDFAKVNWDSPIILPTYEQFRVAMREILGSGEIQIGEIARIRPDMVEFVSWRGSLEQRIDRAWKIVKTRDDYDRSFAYWLCLRRNIDRDEDAVSDIVNQT